MLNLKTLKKSLRVFSIFGLLLGFMALTFSVASADHLSNNRAELSGDGVSGEAIVNYVRGTQSWTSTTTVSGLEAGEYTFAVNLNGGAPTIVCTFMADGTGDAGCTDQDADIPGFNTAVILDSNGDVVADGIFERRGGGRVSNP